VNKIALSLVAIGAFMGTPVLAADMALKAPPPAPAYNWTGFYAGLNIGYGWGNSNTTVNFLDPSGFVLFSATNSFDMSGVIGGGQIGYNWQSGNWVPGLEADFQGSGIRGTGTFVCPAGVCSVTGLPVTETLTEKLQWFGTARGRLGYTVTPTVLLYATGGLAYGEIATSGVIADPTYLSNNTLKAGWTAGGGIEDGVGGNWTVKLEYLFMDLGDVSSNGATVTPVVVPGVPRNCIAACPVNHLSTTYASSGSGITDSILRLGFNYRFPPAK